MCLLTDQICPIKARKDIEVYKVLMYCAKTNTIVTPSIYHPVLTKTMDTYEESIERARAIYHRFAIGKGMIHSYGYNPCTFHIPSEEFISPKYFIVKAIIPKGTLYYKGDSKECASKKLILQDVVWYPHRGDMCKFKKAYESLSEPR